MVFRERQERTAFLEALAHMTARVLGVDPAKAFGRILTDYSIEVQQATYDADVLRRKVDRIRSAQRRVRGERQDRTRQLGRLDRMGEFYDREYGPDLLPAPAKKPQPSKPARR